MTLAFKMRVIEDSIDLQTLINATDEAGDKIMKKCASIIKVRVESRLRSTQRKHVNQNGVELKRPREIHMADDVVIKRGKDRYGYRYAKVGGGKQTGTLWHIVNDGTYKNTATHFMDQVIQDTSSEVEGVIDQELRRTIER